MENMEPQIKSKFNAKEYMRDYHSKMYKEKPDYCKQKRNFYVIRKKYDIKDYDKWFKKYHYDMYNIIKLIEIKEGMKPGHFEQMLMDLRDFEFVKK